MKAAPLSLRTKTISTNDSQGQRRSHVPRRPRNETLWLPSLNRVELFNPSLRCLALPWNARGPRVSTQAAGLSPWFLMGLKQSGEHSHFRGIQIGNRREQEVVRFPGDLVVPVALEMPGRRLLTRCRPDKNIDSMQPPT